MPKVVAIKLPHASQEFWFNPQNLDLCPHDLVICKTAQGLELGECVRKPYEVAREEIVEKTGKDWLQLVDRIATEKDIEQANALREEAKEAVRIFKEEAAALKLDLKVVGVDYLFDGLKAICYFSSEERVDFRELVKKLSEKLGRRVEMKQIGPRQEAALHGGIAHCGCEFCCTKWEKEFSPVSIRMAKDQDLSINGDGISGSCGRLMCCLRYETEAYRDFKKRAPKKGAKIQTPSGTAVVVGFNTPKEEVEIKFDETNKRVRIGLSDMCASQAAKQHAETNNCPLRPDTLSQEGFDKLGLMSFDVAMPKREVDALSADKSADNDKREKKPLRPQKSHGMRPKKERRKRLRIKDNGGAQKQTASSAPENASGEALPTRRVRRIRKHHEIEPLQQVSTKTHRSVPAQDMRPGRSQRENN